MLLTIDIGNSNISLGVFKNDALVLRAKLSSHQDRSADEYAAVLYDLLRIHGIGKEEICDCILSSVVPELTELIEEAVRELTGTEPVRVGPGIRTGFKIRIDDPSELGGDLVANTLAALTEYGAPLILIDAGTVTTISVVDDQRAYLGGSILPGIRASAAQMKAKTALLPSIALGKDIAPDCIGRNTADAMRCGLLMGSGMMIDGFIRTYASLPHMRGTVCVATGGSAELVTAACREKIICDPDLTLKGLRCLYEGRNTKR